MNRPQGSETAPRNPETDPRAAITHEQWNIIVWLTAECSWWRNQLDRRLEDIEDSDEVVWSIEP